MILEHKTIDLFGAMLFEKAVIQPPFTMPNNMSEEACFLYILEGSCNVVAETGENFLSTKESVLMKCGNYFGRAIPDTQSQQYSVLAIHFYPEVLQKIYDNRLPDFLTSHQEIPSKLGLAKIKYDELFSRYIEGILFYFENPALVSEELLVLKLKEIILLLSNTDRGHVVHRILSNLFQPTNLRFKEVVEANLYKNITLENLAILCGLSLSSFKREFKKVYEVSPATYIRNEKLRKAEELLRCTTEPVSNIAYDTGFADLSNFSRAFKTRYGKAPSEVRGK